jgi:hypothetical protein
MSKVLSVENGNYIVKVESGKNIILDTSRGVTNSNNDLVGEVIINGGLLVKGTTTSVNSQNTNIADNIIVLNKYIEDPDNPNQALPDGIVDISRESGIEIDRGSLSDARFVFDDDILWNNNTNSSRGTFTFKLDGMTEPLPIYVGGIKTAGKFLIDSPSAISVQLIADYEQKINWYEDGIVVENNGTTFVDPDHIPNCQAMADYVTYAFTNIGTGAVIEAFDTKFIVSDFEASGSESRADAVIDGNTQFTVFSSRIETPGIKLWNDSTIQPRDLDTNLTLKAPGQSSVVVDDILELTKTPHESDPKIDPEFPSNGIKIYTKASDSGGTGLYFANENEIIDEFISKNRSIVYSMIF